MTARPRRRLVAAALVLAGLTGCGATPTTGSVGAPAPAPTAAATLGPEPSPPTGTAGCPAATGAAPAKDGLPALTLTCVTGPGKVDLAALAVGTPVVVNIWASWCEPCRAEMPWLADLDQRAGASLSVLGVLSDDPTDNWPAVLDETGARYASVRDDEGVLLHRFVGSPGPPVTLFVRGDGTLAGRHIGAFKSQADLDAAVRQMLGVTL